MPLTSHNTPLPFKSQIVYMIKVVDFIEKSYLQEAGDKALFTCWPLAKFIRCQKKLPDVYIIRCLTVIMRQTVCK